MNRPTRQLKHLLSKIERKEAQSRGRGNKLKRWAKAVETYKARTEDTGAGSEGAGESES